MRGLWRIYMNNAEAKAKLYTDGMTFRSKSVILYEQNPFSMNEESDVPEKKHVRVSIQNLPLSVSNQEVETMIKNFGCKIEKDLAYECERDGNGKLTSLKNGNRIVYVDMLIC